MISVIHPPPRELAHVERASNIGATGPTIADLAGLSITFVAGVRPVMLEAWCGYAGFSATGQYGVLYITDAANVIQSEGVASAVTDTNLFANSVSVRRKLTTLTPGTSYTFKCRANCSGAGVSVTFQGGATNPMFLRAIEI